MLFFNFTIKEMDISNARDCAPSAVSQFVVEALNYARSGSTFSR